MRILLCLLAATTAFAQDQVPLRDRSYVSLLGNQVLAKSDGLFRGRVLARHTVAGGLVVVRIQCLEVLAGIDPGPEASVMAGSEESMPEPNQDLLVFASRLSSESLWKSEGHFFLDADLGTTKLALVRKLIEIEALPTRDEKILRLRKLAVLHLGEVDPWLAWNAAQEILHLVFELNVDLDEAERNRISDLTMQSDDDRFASYLQSILMALRARRGEVVDVLSSPGAPSGEVVESAPPQERAPTSEAAHIRELAESFLDETDPPEARRLLLELSAYELPLVDRLLVRALSHRQTLVRAEAALLLGDRDPTAVEGALVAALADDPSVRVRRNAAKSLGRLGGDRAVQSLARHLEDPAVRRDCLAGLAATGSPEARRLLQGELSRLEPGPSPERALLEDLLKP